MTPKALATRLRNGIGGLAIGLAGVGLAVDAQNQARADEPTMRRVPAAPGAIWMRHTVDDTSRGADGVKLADLDGDGRPEVVTGWEEGGQIRLYRNPGPRECRTPWPRITVGQVESPEEAIFADIDGDGRTDILSCTEGSTKSVFAHRMRNGSAPPFDAANWTTEAIRATRGRQQWMQAVVLKDRDGDPGRIVLGAKNEGASVGWLRLPRRPSLPDEIEYVRLRDAGWIMSLIALDIDADGDDDLILTDRRGPRSGAYWLENPGDRAEGPWTEHAIGAMGREVMFADTGDIDGDGRTDLAVAVKPHDLFLFLRTSTGGWKTEVLNLEADTIGRAKAVAIADVDGDGSSDLLFTCEGADGPKEGIGWVRQGRGGLWNRLPLGGPDGVKFDLMQMLDIDDDGDLDVLTCEERDDLGVIWYENPGHIER